jgi:hypothetical protein
VEPAYNRTKESIIFQIRHAKSVAGMRRALTSWPALIAYLFITIIVALAIY